MPSPQQAGVGPHNASRVSLISTDTLNFDPPPAPLAPSTPPPPLPPRKQSKKVYTRSFWRALGRFILFHVPAIGITLGLLDVYLKQLTWNATADQLAGLLFAAKVHEALIIASLFDMVYYSICRAILGRRGVPFGYLTAAFQLNSPFYFLSREFWSPLASLHRSGTASSFGIALLLLVSFLVASLAGASSGVIILPKVGWWHFTEGTSTIWRTLGGSDPGLDGQVVSPADAMYPLRVDLGTVREGCLNPEIDNSSTYLSYCPFSDFADPANGAYVPMRAMDNIGSGTTNLTLSVSDGRMALLYNDIVSSHVAVATCPVVLVHDLLVSTAFSWTIYRTDEPIKITPKLSGPGGRAVSLKQPRVVVQCIDAPVPLVPLNANSSRPSYNFRITTSYYPGGNFTLDRELFESALDSGASFGFLDLNPYLSFQTSVAIWTIQYDPLVGEMSLGLCLVDARWLTSDMWIIPAGTAVSTTQHSVTVDRNETLNYRIQDPAEIITIDPAWCNLLNVSLVDEDGRLNYSFTKIESYHSQFLFQEGVAMNLAVFLADGLAFVPYAHSWRAHWTRGGPWKANPNFDTPFGVVDELSDYILITADYYQNGYAYNFTEITTVLSWTVLFVHLFLVLVHFFMVFMCGGCWYTNAWSSLGQVLALALDSRPTGELIGEGGAVVNKGATWNLRAVVRDTDELNGQVGIVLTKMKGKKESQDPEVRGRLIPPGKRS
ncbi:hypothetical protein QBC37DRAFT_323607 [Rhypophila decipiens]|uniref:Uncharacterized protein n=1 Tax=Rhypophila decipiens TaxID=261697 RepID=A0AAN6Y1I8_9PEZI|nr:hypothetical protein QBC37DRAFT_323607 [Rhypophila decipiens]